MYLFNICLVFALVVLTGNQQVHSNVHSCVRAARKIWKTGDGSTPGSCMSCDPTYPFCSQGCQGYIKALYYDCDGVCLPDGYYFDPKFTLEGCWGDNKPDIKIAVERCGCNSALSSRFFSMISTICVVCIGCILTLFVA